MCAQANSVVKLKGASGATCGTWRARLLNIGWARFVHRPIQPRSTPPVCSVPSERDLGKEVSLADPVSGKSYNGFQYTRGNPGRKYTTRIMLQVSRTRVRFFRPDLEFPDITVHHDAKLIMGRIAKIPLSPVVRTSTWSMCQPPGDRFDSHPRAPR